MKVAIISDDIDISSGIGRYNHELIKGLYERGITADLITVRKHKIPFSDLLNHIIRLPYMVLKKKGEYDVIHATTPVTGLVFAIMRDKKKIVTYHDLTSLLCKETGSRLHVRAGARFFLKIGKFCDGVIAVSSQTKDELIKYLGFSEKKISVVNLGIDDKFKPLEKRKQDGAVYYIGYLGDLNRRKCVSYLIKAFAQFRKKYPIPEAKLAIYGKGDESYRLKKTVPELKLEGCVEFKSLAPEEQLVEIYNSFDVFVLPSEWEGFGLPILEAQRCGVPVIIREDAHIPLETARFCLKAQSQDDMAYKFFQLLTDDDLREKTIKAGLEYSKQYTWEGTVEETLKLYEEVLQKGSL